MHIQILLSMNPFISTTAIALGFEYPSYTFSEDNGMVNDVIKVVKDNGVVSEQTFNIILNKQKLTATEGQPKIHNSLHPDFVPYAIGYVTCSWPNKISKIWPGKVTRLFICTPP